MDRNDDGYLLLAFHGDTASSFHSASGIEPHSFTPTLPSGNFKDHDDVRPRPRLSFAALREGPTEAVMCADQHHLEPPDEALGRYAVRTACLRPAHLEPSLPVAYPAATASGRGCLCTESRVHRRPARRRSARLGRSSGIFRTTAAAATLCGPSRSAPAATASSGAATSAVRTPRRCQSGRGPAGRSAKPTTTPTSSGLTRLRTRRRCSCACIHNAPHLAVLRGLSPRRLVARGSYRVRPFYIGDTGRLAAHALQYAPSPAEMNNVSQYGCAPSNLVLHG